MQSIIDLHTHSTASDGTDTPRELLEKAKFGGIKVFSITDHDTVAGVRELIGNIPDGIIFIPGVEFSCWAKAGKCHILGYNCDIDNPVFQGVLREGAELRAAKLESRLNYLADRGIRFPDEEMDKLRQLSSVGKPHLGSLMVKYRFAKTIQEAIKNVINHCEPGPSRISAKTAIRAILASGGIPIWAHPLGGEGEETGGAFGETLRELMGYGLMGLECFYSKYPMTDCGKLTRVAGENGLLISGGSDYHGANKAVELGKLNACERAITPEQLTVAQLFMRNSHCQKHLKEDGA